MRVTQTVPERMEYRMLKWYGHLLGMGDIDSLSDYWSDRQKGRKK